VSALYTALAILGIIAAGLTLLGIWLLFEHVLDFAAKTHEDFDRDFAHGDCPHLPRELRTSQRKGAHRASAGPSGTYSTHFSLSGPLSGAGGF
jgi:hypothetical protein